jgi:predicted dehydrogenase
VGFISLGYQGDLFGNIHVSWADPNKVRELVVVSSSKRIVFDDLNDMERIRIFEKGVEPADPEAASFGEYHFLMRDGDIISPKIEVSEPLKNQCSHFLHCIRSGETPETHGPVGLEVVKAMEAIDKSMEENGTPVEIEPAKVFA